jgi:GT2 family glycosyltransferase
MHGAAVLHANNHGFGHACNAGAAQARGRYLLFLNSDTVLEDCSLDRAVKYMDADSRIGALGIKTTLADGSFDHASKRGFPTPFNAFCYFLGLDRLFPRCKAFGGYRLAYLDPETTVDVDAVSGSFMLVHRQLFDSLGGFDEAYFMYGEDVDLCWRIKGAGRRVVYFAGASMRHLKGQSGLNTDDPAVCGYFYDVMEIFYNKHLRYSYGPLMAISVRFAIRARHRLALRRLRQLRHLRHLRHPK